MCRPFTSGGIDFSGHIGQFESVGLKRRDRFAELGAFVAVFQGDIKTALGTAKPHCPDGETAAVQGLDHLPEPLTPFPQEVFLGNPAIVKVQLAGIGRPPHHFVVHPPGIITGCILFN
jgi:hypothetical protein